MDSSGREGNGGGETGKEGGREGEHGNTNGYQWLGGKPDDITGRNCSPDAVTVTFRRPPHSALPSVTTSVRGTHHLTAQTAWIWTQYTAVLVF